MDEKELVVEGLEKAIEHNKDVRAESGLSDSNAVNYKAIELLVPDDTEVVSVTVVRAHKMEYDVFEDIEFMPQTSLIVSCFPGDVDLHDCTTGYSYRQDEEGRLYMVLDADEDYKEFELSELSENAKDMDDITPLEDFADMPQ